MIVLRVIIWLLAATVVMTMANLILSMPLGIYAQRMWSAREPQLEAGIPIAEAFPNKGILLFLYGIAMGALVAGGVAALTRTLVSSHWGYQAALAVGSFLEAGKLQGRYLKTGVQHRLMFGLAGDRAISIMYGGYGWGAIVGVAAVALWRGAVS